MLLLDRHRAHRAQSDIFKLLKAKLRAPRLTRVALVRKQLRVHHQLLMDVWIVKLAHFKVLRVTSSRRALVVVLVRIKISLVRIRALSVKLASIKIQLVRIRALLVLVDLINPALASHHARYVPLASIEQLLGRQLKSRLVLALALLARSLSLDPHHALL